MVATSSTNAIIVQLKDQIGKKTLLEDTIKLIKGSSQHKNMREIQLHVALALNLLQLNRLRRIEPHIRRQVFKLTTSPMLNNLYVHEISPLLLLLTKIRASRKQDTFSSPYPASRGFYLVVSIP